MKRLEFSDSQKAKIYTRDKGICAFSGKILWVFHYGVSVQWDMDWVDHILPAMKWGDNSIENGICASSFFNSKKKDNSYDNKYLFLNGMPTEYFYHAHGYIPQELSQYLLRMENMHDSDWYFNRAICSFMLVLDRIANPYDQKGNLTKRDELYWAKSALKKLELWRKKSEWIENFVTRLWISSQDISEDQKIMLEIIETRDEQDMLHIAKKLLPYYQNSKKYFNSLIHIKNNQDVNALSNSIFESSYISQRDKAILTDSLENFYKPLTSI